MDFEAIETEREKWIGIINKADYYKDKALIIDTRKMSNYDFTSLNGYINRFVKHEAVIYIEQWTSKEERYKNDVPNKYLEDIVTISLSSEAGDELLRMGKCKLRISVNAEKRNDAIGRSVMAYIPGTDEARKNDFVIIGSNLDGIGYDIDEKYPSAGRAPSAAISLEIARIMTQNGIKPDMDMIFYFDFMNLGYKGSNKLMIDNSKVFPKSKKSRIL